MASKVRNFIFAFVLGAFASVSNAQEFEDYGKVLPKELALKECSFDKEAAALVLLDEAISNYDEEHHFITDRHVRIKILQEKGIEYANIAIPFWRFENFEFISNVEGLIINTNPDGSFTKQALEKKSIFTKNITEHVGEVRFTFPSVKAGSIIEYKYKSVMKNYNGLDDWHFQKHIPVVQSKYLLHILPNFEFAYQVYKNSNLELKIEPDAQLGRVRFEMKNIPGLNEEPYMDARRDYIQRVTFQLSGYGGGGFNKRKYMNSWDEVTKELMGNGSLGSQLNKELAGTEGLIKLWKLNPSSFEKMKMVYNYVKNYMVWNGYPSKYSSDGIKSAWNKKTGTNGDINLILVNLLRSTGLEAYPMLVSERYNGKVNTQYPFLDQFNTVFAVVIIEGKKYYLDATDKLTPPHITPYSILNTTAFILNKKAGGLVNITDDSHTYQESILVKIAVTPEDNMKGEVSLYSRNYAKIRRLESFSSNNERYIEENFKKSANAIVIDSFRMVNEDKDSIALQQSFSFTTPIASTGDYKFIPLNLFSGFQINPFVSNTRFSDINFGYKRNIVLNTHIDLPLDYKVDVIPKSIQVTNPDKTVLFSRQVFLDEPNKKIISRIKMDFAKSFYTPDEYADIQEFYKTMFEMVNEQIVLKKDNL
jgi:hypothetical protein